MSYDVLIVLSAQFRWKGQYLITFKAVDASVIGDVHWIWSVFRIEIGAHYWEWAVHLIQYPSHLIQCLNQLVVGDVRPFPDQLIIPAVWDFHSFPDEADHVVDVVVFIFKDQWIVLLRNLQIHSFCSFDIFQMLQAVGIKWEADFSFWSVFGFVQFNLFALVFVWFYGFIFKLFQQVPSKLVYLAYRNE